MRTYYDIELSDRRVEARELHGEAIVRAGRYLIAKMLLEMRVAGVDPLSPENPLIFSAGPFAGTAFSNANPHKRGLQEPAHGWDQGGERGRYLRLRARPAGNLRIDPARGISGLGRTADD